MKLLTTALALLCAVLALGGTLARWSEESERGVVDRIRGAGL